MPVSTNFLRMKAEHGITKTRIACTYVKDGMTGVKVDGRNENVRTTSLTGTLYHSIAVGSKFLAIQVAMGIDEL